MKLNPVTGELEGTPQELAEYTRLTSSPVVPLSRQTKEPLVYSGSLNGKLTDAQLETVEAVNSWGDVISPTELGDLLGIHRGAASQRLIAATAKGAIRRLSEGRYAPLSFSEETPEEVLRLGSAAREVYELIKGHPGITLDALARQLRKSKPAISSQVHQLRKRGLIIDLGKGRYRAAH
ncbi:helix-turn-helix DNA binding protein [Gordonia phage AndPeggy]|nr:helix-turn-helix DNA binding protein [Gordonia phage AndPeggy]